MTESTDVGEFDRFVEHLPEDVARSIHFVPVKENKAADVPEEQDVKKEEFRLNLEEARERLQSGENVGPVFSDQLSVLILMNSEEARAFLENLPSTLGVSTRSGETHLYFLRGDGVESKDIPGIAELRTGDRYVVAPGSYASDGSGDSWGAYTVEEAKEAFSFSAIAPLSHLCPNKGVFQFNHMMKKTTISLNVRHYTWMSRNPEFCLAAFVRRKLDNEIEKEGHLVKEYTISEWLANERDIPQVLEGVELGVREKAIRIAPIDDSLGETMWLPKSQIENKEPIGLYEEEVCYPG